MLIVSSLSKARAAFDAYAPVRVVSLLSEDEGAPVFPGLSESAYLRLYVERDACAATINGAARKRAEALIAFMDDWDGDGSILVHCNRGVSRSSASAFIIQCLVQPDRAETALAAALRAAAPHVDPCPLIVAHADDILGRNGRMIDAIEDLCSPCIDVDAPFAVLPLGR